MKGLPLLLVAALATACQQAAPPAAAPPAALAAPVSAPSYADELKAAEQAVREVQAAIARGPVVWPQWANLAGAQRAAAQLTGDYRYYLEAEQSLAQAFALAGKGGPYLARAQFNFSVHRLTRVEPDLVRASAESDPDATAILALRADLAFYHGEYDAALSGYRQALERREDLPSLVRLALWHARMGHVSEALALLDRAEAIYHGDSQHPRAFLALQRGLIELDRGRWERALAHYQHALRLLPGWWLAAEHIAEIHALQGDTEAALREYGEVIQQTNHPEFMDAMAELLRARGDETAAQGWITKARQRYEERLATLPEATYGHGLSHFLQFGTPAEALALARKNHALRPYGEAQIQLAEALLRAGEAREAERLMRSALASGWRTAELHAIAAQAFAATGQRTEAARHSAQARALNPRAARQYGLPEEASAAQRTAIPLNSPPTSHPAPQ
ncbi:MAG: hypothetical protein Q7J29_13575 [Stagnimonas sp.]|nr:hypothetical protein [Stagnimonas sp.]